MWGKRKRPINKKTGRRKYIKKSPLKKLDKKAEDLCRKITRKIFRNRCCKCLAFVNGSNSHPAHIVSRKNKVLRYDLMNLILLCFHCHQELHGEGGMKEWVKEAMFARYYYLFEPCDEPCVDRKPLCNQKLPYMTPKEKVERMELLVLDLQKKLSELLIEFNELD